MIIYCVCHSLDSELPRGRTVAVKFYPVSASPTTVLGTEKRCILSDK